MRFVQLNSVIVNLLHVFRASITLLFWGYALVCQPNIATTLVDCFYIVLFSALEHVSWHEWLAFFSILQCRYGWCQMKLQPSWSVMCTLYNHILCHFIHSRIYRVHACSAVTCHLHFWQNDRDLLHATAVQKADPGEEDSPTVPAGFQTHDLSIMSLAWQSNHWAIPAPLRDFGQLAIGF